MSFQLDELGVDYHSPPVDDNYDLTMIITLKQLLMFAVQISYGLVRKITSLEEHKYLGVFVAEGIRASRRRR